MFFFVEKKITKNKQRETTNKIRRYSVFAVFPLFLRGQKCKTTKRTRKKNNNLGSSLVCSRKTKLIRKKRKHLTVNISWEVLSLVCFVSFTFVFSLYVQYNIFYLCCIFQ